MDRSNINEGLFIIFEGLDGCGKSTQVSMLTGFLEQRGIKYTYVREPGGTKVGDQIREILLNPETKLSSWGEVLLYAAARAQLVQDVIRPALARGEVVVGDRYLFSSLAYQGYGLEQDVELVRRVNLEAVQGLLPNHVFLLRVTPEMGLSRQAGQRDLDRIELRNHQFFHRVYLGYEKLAATYGFSVLNGSERPEDIHHQVVAKIEHLIYERGERG